MQPNLLIPVAGFLIGLIFGSLVDCLASRSLTRQSFRGRSFCNSCKKTLNWYDLFPVLSYLSTTGRCRYCQAKIPSECLLIEILTGLLIALLFYQLVPSDILTLKWDALLLLIPELIFKIFVICVLVSVFITDIKTGLIPDRITYPSILIAFGYLLLYAVLKISLIYYTLSQSEFGKLFLPPHSDFFYRHAYIATEQLRFGLLGALALGIFFLTLILVTKGRGMGGGDFKLGIFLGFVFGLPNSIIALMVAFLSGSIVGVFLLIFGKRKFGQTIPFGPFLSLGALATLYWGDKLASFYMNLKLN